MQSSMVCVSINHFHCDNARFADNLFKRDIQNNRKVYLMQDSMHFFRIVLLRYRFMIFRNKKKL